MQVNYNKNIVYFV